MKTWYLLKSPDRIYRYGGAHRMELGRYCVHDKALLGYEVVRECQAESWKDAKAQFMQDGGAA